jgi:iron complex transport system permease protein
LTTATADRPIASAPTLPKRRDARVRRWRWICPALIAAIILVSVASLLVGLGNMLTPADAFRALFGIGEVPLLHEIAIDSRLPRIGLAILAGVSLGAAGALLQALTRNALAAPEIIGVADGAIAAVLAFLAFGPAIPFGLLDIAIPMIAMAGGLLAAVIVYLLSRRLGRVESTRFIMIGILFGGILASVSTASLIFLGTQVTQILGYLIGSLDLKTWEDVGLAAAYVAPGLILLVWAIPRCNALQLGDDVARGLGQRKDLDRVLVLTTCVALTAGIVAVVGGIGFVGLIGPHMVRRWVGSDLRRLVPAAALAGALMVLIADFLARNFDSAWILDVLGQETAYGQGLPVGVFLTLFGVPFLISLLWRKRDDHD